MFNLVKYYKNVGSPSQTASWLGGACNMVAGPMPLVALMISSTLARPLSNRLAFITSVSGKRLAGFSPVVPSHLTQRLKQLLISVTESLESVASSLLGEIPVESILWMSEEDATVIEMFEEIVAADLEEIVELSEATRCQSLFEIEEWSGDMPLETAESIGNLRAALKAARLCYETGVYDVPLVA